jgi:hypothetical protein
MAVNCYAIFHDPPIFPIICVFVGLFIAGGYLGKRDWLLIVVDECFILPENRVVYVYLVCNYSTVIISIY